MDRLFDKLFDEPYKVQIDKSFSSMLSRVNDDEYPYLVRDTFKSVLELIEGVRFSSEFMPFHSRQKLMENPTIIKIHHDDVNSRVDEMENVTGDNWLYSIPPYKRGVIAVDLSITGLRKGYMYFDYDVIVLDLDEKTMLYTFNTYLKIGFSFIPINCMVVLSNLNSNTQALHNTISFHEAISLCKKQGVFNKEKFIKTLKSYPFYNQNNSFTSLIESEYRGNLDVMYDNISGFVGVILQAHSISLNMTNSSHYAGLFETVVFAINKCFAEERAKKPFYPKHKINHKIDSSEPKDVSDKRRYYQIGGVEVETTENTPKVHTMETIRKYKCAEWSRRGHIRNLSNGKTTYIKPTTVHRRATGESTLIKKTYTIV